MYIYIYIYIYIISGGLCGRRHKSSDRSECSVSVRQIIFPVCVIIIIIIIIVRGFFVSVLFI